MNTIEKLTKFVNQRPGLDFCNYGDSKSYNAESREITRDRNDFYELLSLFLRRYEGGANDALTKELTNTTGRLTLKGDNLEYCTGQYFCTEYRPAANRVLVSLIWNSYRDEKNSEGEPVYKTGPEFRKAIKSNLSRRIGKLYFN